MNRLIPLGLLLATCASAATAQAGVPFCCWHERYQAFKDYMHSADSYYLSPPLRPHACKLPLRPRVEYSPTIVPGASSSQLESRVPAYTRPPATVYGPGVAAPGPGVPIYGPHDNAIDPQDPLGTVFPVYPPAYGTGDPRCSVFHPK